MKDTVHEHPLCPDAELAALWRSGGDVVVDALIDRLHVQVSRLQRLNWLSVALCVPMFALLLVLELVGQLPTGGLLSAAGAVSVLFSLWRYRYRNTQLLAAYSTGPAQLLPFLIQRTRAARNLGYYYAVASLPGVLLGYYGARFIGKPDAETASGPVLYALIALALPVLVGVTVWGWRLARRKSAELRELQSMAAELEHVD